MNRMMRLTGLILDTDIRVNLLTANCDRNMFLNNIVFTFCSAHVHTAITLLNIRNCQCAVFNVSTIRQTTVLFKPVYSDRDLVNKMFNLNVAKFDEIAVASELAK